MLRRNPSVFWKVLAAAVLVVAAPAKGNAQEVTPTARHLVISDTRNATVETSPDSNGPYVQTGLRIHSVEPSKRRDHIVVFGDPRDYRWEGAIAGAALFALLVGGVAYDLCSDDEGNRCAKDLAGGMAIGATVGTVIGGFTGWLIKK